MTARSTSKRGKSSVRSQDIHSLAFARFMSPVAVLLGILKRFVPESTLRFTEGGRSVIRARNQMDVETSIRRHGMLRPNAKDGVPFVMCPRLKRHGFEPVGDCLESIEAGVNIGGSIQKGRRG